MNGGFRCNQPLLLWNKHGTESWQVAVPDKGQPESGMLNMATIHLRL